MKINIISRNYDVILIESVVEPIESVISKIIDLLSGPILKTLMLTTTLLFVNSKVQPLTHQHRHPPYLSHQEIKKSPKFNLFRVFQRNEAFLNLHNSMASSAKKDLGSGGGLTVSENALITTLVNSIQAVGRGFDVTSDIRLLYCKGTPGSRLVHIGLVHIDEEQTRDLEIS